MTRLNSFWQKVIVVAALLGFSLVASSYGAIETIASADKIVPQQSAQSDIYPSPDPTTGGRRQIYHQLLGESSQEKLTALDAQADDEFGWAVAIDEDTVVIGARYEDGGPGDPLEDAGAAYVFNRSQGATNTWVQVAKLIADDAMADNQFGSSVAISGDTIIVSGLPLTGAYIFDRDQGGPEAWGQVAKLDYGGGVAISGDTAVTSGGAVFERNQGGPNAWGQVATLSNGGFVAAINGDIIVVGYEYGNGGPGGGTGEAYVFERNQGGTNAWGKIITLTASDAQPDDQFGFSVAVDGDTIVVGASTEDGGPGDPLNFTGAAYIFGRNQGGTNVWGEVVKLIAPDAVGGEFFGSSVAITGDSLVVGAAQSGAGAAYLFRRDQGSTQSWEPIIKLTSSDGQLGDYFGRAVTTSGQTIVIGAFAENGGAGDPLHWAGAAYVFWRNPVYLPTFMKQ